MVTPAKYADSGGFSEAYAGTVVQKMVDATKGLMDVSGFVKGDPGRAARVIVGAVDGGYGYLRLPLGGDCVRALEDKIGELGADLDATRALALSTDVD